MFIIVFITEHCSCFDIKIMYVLQKLNESNNIESVKMTISDKHFKVLFDLFKIYLESKGNLWLFFTTNQVCASFHTNSMNAADLFCKRKYKISTSIFLFFHFVQKLFWKTKSVYYLLTETHIQFHLVLKLTS